jgi:hypothetical protein
MVLAGNGGAICQSGQEGFRDFLFLVEGQTHTDFGTGQDIDRKFVRFKIRKDTGQESITSQHLSRMNVQDGNVSFVRNGSDLSKRMVRKEGVRW